MSSIIYEGLGPPPPPPPTVGDGQIVLTGLGFARGFESGAIGDGVLSLLPGPGGRLPPPITVCSGDARIPLSAGFSFAIGVAPPAHGDGEIALRGSGSWSSTVGDGVIRVAGAGSELATPPTDGEDIVRLTARMGGALIQRSRETAALRAGVLLSPVMRGSWIGTRRLQSVVSFEEALTVVYHDLVQLALSAGDGFALTSTAIEQMIDALLLSGAVVTELDAVTLVTEAITFGALLDGHAVNTLLVGLAASDTVATVYTAAAKLVDGLLAGVALEGSAVLMGIMRDELRARAAPATALDAFSILRDGLDFVLRVNVDGHEYVAWVMNTQTKAMSRYTNYPFNSFFELGGRFFGAMDNGVYRLDGDSDAGEPINARIRQGMSSFGTQVKKGFPAMYLGYTANGDLLLQVVLANPTTSEREAHAYRLKARAAESAREGRAKVGRGLSSVYYDYVLENIDGADFSLDLVEILPLNTRRRVRGNSSGRR